MADIREVAGNIFEIDDELYSIPRIGSVYFLVEDRKALIDTGPTTSSQIILRGIRQLGYRPEDVDYIFLTHIHLDHAGGAGNLLLHMPRARVVAHNRSIRHLADPSKLVKSAIEAQGPGTMIRNGDILPIKQEQASAAYDGETIELSGNQILTLFDCPGHAPHELCIKESRNQGIFVGDAVGHQVAGTDVMIPITPPPGFDLELYTRTLNRLMNLHLSKIYFAHSGASDQVQAKLAAAIKKLQDRDDIIARAVAENQIDRAADRVIAHICGELDSMMAEMRPAYDYWTGFDIPMSAKEHVRYYLKKHGFDLTE